jgi:predicted esterase YcpF (UPF0227 family)
MKILYIHGFNSGPGAKSQTLAESFPAAEVVSPQLKNSPLEDIEELQQHLNCDDEICIVGTSLGAFYAMYLAIQNSNQNNYHFYFINPPLRPADKFALEINKDYINYVTSEKFTVTQQMVTELSSMQLKIQQNFSVLNNSAFFLSADDEILSFELLIELITSDLKSYHLIQSEQNHRHENISEVITQIDGVINSSI